MMELALLLLVVMTVVSVMLLLGSRRMEVVTVDTVNTVNTVDTVDTADTADTYGNGNRTFYMKPTRVVSHHAQYAPLHGEIQEVIEPPTPVMPLQHAAHRVTGVMTIRT